MRVTIRSLGSSRYITIPPKELKKRKLTTGDDIDLLFPDEAIDEIKNIINKLYIDWQEIEVKINSFLSSHQSQNENNENKNL